MIKNKVGMLVLLVSLVSVKTASAEGVVSGMIGNFMHDASTKIGTGSAPELGQLKYVLPIAVLCLCAKKFPKQTLLVLAFIIAYLLVKNDTIKEIINELINGKEQDPVTPIDEYMFASGFPLTGSCPGQQQEADEQQGEEAVPQVCQSPEYNVQEFVQVTNQCAPVVGGLEEMATGCTDSAASEMHDEMQVAQDEFASQEASHFQSDEDEEVAIENSLVGQAIQQTAEFDKSNDLDNAEKLLMVKPLEE